MRFQMLAAAAFVALAVAAPAQALHTIGFQTVADFEEVSPETTNIYYPGNDTYIFGGTVVDGAGAGFAPRSGSNVYVGTTISTRQTSGDWHFDGVDLWPALGAWVTPGAATVFATFYGYDPDLDDVVVVGELQTSGSDPMQHLVLLSDYGPAWLINVTFTSTDTFAGIGAALRRRRTATA